MRSKTLVVLAAALWVVGAAFASAATETAAPAVQISIQTDRPDAVYTKGETATFLIKVARGDEPVPEATLACELSTDAFRTAQKRQVGVVDGLARVSASRQVPCVLWIRLTYEGPDGEKVQKVGGCAFSPEEIAPSMPPPEDFDRFWQGQLERLAAVPPNPVVEPMEGAPEGIELYSVTLDNVSDTKIYGYLAKPTGPGPFPAYLQVQWAGVYSLKPEWVIGPAQMGFIALDINAHAIPNGKPDEFYKQLSEGPLKGYPYQGRESRETYYFLRMYLSCVQAANYLAGRPEWDGRHFVVSGGSQGGAQAIVTAALCPQVTALAASVPALCDLTARVLPDRAPGWPMPVAFENGKPNPAHLETARYYDVVNFARKVSVPALVGTGFADLVCPACSVFAAYNVLKGPKQMVLDPQVGHVGARPNWWKAYVEFLRSQGGLETR